MKIDVDKRWRVRATDSLDIPMSAQRIWELMRDLPTFLCIDPLHARVILECEHATYPPLPGTQLRIQHRVLGIGPDRVGRILRWREQEGYVVSDLSKRGVRVGFPHVCVYELRPITDETCRLTLGARGVWTARWMPRLCAKAWLAWVLAATRSRLQLQLARLGGSTE